MKLKKKAQHFQGYATYVYLSLSVYRSVVEIFQEFLKFYFLPNLLIDVYILYESPRGEIGRHKGLKILALLGVPVRVLAEGTKNDKIKNNFR